MAAEEPEFEVVAVHGEVEIRRDAPVIPAETRVDAGFEGAGNQAFGLRPSGDAVTGQAPRPRTLRLSEANRPRETILEMRDVFH